MRQRKRQTNTTTLALSLLFALTISLVDAIEDDEFETFPPPPIDCTQLDSKEDNGCTEKTVSKSDDQLKVNRNQTVLDYCIQLNSDCVKTCVEQPKCQSECPVCPLNANKLAPEVLSKIGLSTNCRQYTATCLKFCNSTKCRIDCIRRGCSPQLSRSNAEPNEGSGLHTVIVHQENTISGQTNSTTQRFESKYRPGQNITTVIRLANVVNNTNYVETPINITSDGKDETVSVNANKTASDTHLNEISSAITESSSGGAFGIGYNADGSCCLAIRPKSCRASTNGLRCHHRRHRTCGPQCTAHTIHVQLRKHCHHNGNQDCSHGIAYVPQPRRPNCIYIEQWPFVSCSLDFERHLFEKNCVGCYDHYGFGFHQFHENAEHHRIRCRGCYDDGFEYGPLYRRGPVLRPYFYHQAPCHVTGRCRASEWYNIDCGHYGCFGDEFVDPVWGRHRHRPHSREDQFHDVIDKPRFKPPPPTAKHNTQIPELFNVDADVLETPSTTTIIPADSSQEVKNTTDDSDDWGVHINKCKVVLDDGSIKVRNCTDQGINTNPYAASPVDDPQPVDDQEEDDDEDQFLTDYNDEDNDIIDEEEDNTPDELIRATRSHGKNKRPILNYDDFDEYDNYIGNQNRYPQQHQKHRNFQKHKNRSRNRRRFRIVYDDVDASDYE